MRLPNPNDFRSPNEFISAVESLGRCIGAKALGPACIGLVAVRGADTIAAKLKLGELHLGDPT